MSDDVKFHARDPRLPVNWSIHDLPMSWVLCGNLREWGRLWVWRRHPTRRLDLEEL